MSKQLYLEAIEALRQRVEAAGEDEELHVLDMLAEEIVKALARFNVAQRAESAEPPPDDLRPDVEVIPADFEGDIKIAQMVKTERYERIYGRTRPDEYGNEEDPDAPGELSDEEAAENERRFWDNAGRLDGYSPEDDDDDLFTGGDWDPEEDSDLWEDDPDVAPEYTGDDDGEDDESGL